MNERVCSERSVNSRTRRVGIVFVELSSLCLIHRLCVQRQRQPPRRCGVRWKRRPLRRSAACSCVVLCCAVCWLLLLCCLLFVFCFVCVWCAVVRGWPRPAQCSANRAARRHAAWRCGRERTQRSDPGERNTQQRRGKETRGRGRRRGRSGDAHCGGGTGGGRGAHSAAAARREHTTVGRPQIEQEEAREGEREENGAEGAME